MIEQSLDGLIFECDSCRQKCFGSFWGFKSMPDSGIGSSRGDSSYQGVASCQGVASFHEVDVGC